MAHEDEAQVLSSDSTFDPYPYLATLNDAQRTAVTYPPDAPLQVLAGPGSGKTKVLTARVAYLIHHFKLDPSEVVAVTFTNKAALEMKKRLNALLGELAASKLVLGTFHATCVKYLRKYGKLIGLNNNFSIIDQDDAKKLVAGFLKPIAQGLKEAHTPLKPDQVLSEISNAKAKAESPAGMKLRAEALAGNGQILMVMADLYEQYEKALKELGSLDFDDLLVYGLRLLEKEKRVISSVRHVLVDEFQDTNTTQYNLMKAFAKRGHVTIVGDPDQSIYSWRAADIENLHHMKRDYPDTEEVHLEQNYRSTGAILDASLAIVSQDKKRIKKGLYTAFGAGVPVTLKQTPNGFAEADYIADEIHRLRAQSGNMLSFDDFAILLRYNALSRVLETCLQKAQIPTRLVGGHKFFERLEVKDILAYLQLIDNPQYYPAFVRVINVPKRGIGEKSLQAILERAKAKGITAMEMAERIADGDVPSDLSVPQRKNLVEFVRVIRVIRVQAKNGAAVTSLIENLLEETGYEAHLKRTQADFDSRWENVKELISYAVLVGKEQEASGVLAPTSSQKPATPNGVSQHAQTSSTRGTKRKATGEASEVIDLEYEETETEAATLPATEVVDDDEDLSATPLRAFLEASMLATDAETQDENTVTPRVTICTVHAAKGLEWPVVFVPCAERGVFPFVRSSEEAQINEERRLLYVAMTRAQVVLEITHAEKRMAGKEEIPKELSPFIMDCYKEGEKPIFDFNYPTISKAVRELMSSILGRKAIPEEEVTKIIHAYILGTAGAKRSWEGSSSQGNSWRSQIPGSAAFYHNSHNKEHRAQQYWNSDKDEYALPDMPGMPQSNGVSLSQPAVPGFVSASQLRSQMPVSATQVPVMKASERMRAVQYTQPIFAGSQRAWNESAPQPFSFGTPADMSISTTASKPSSSFQTATNLTANKAIMQNIGLPPPISALSNTPPKINGPAQPGLNTLQTSFSSSLASLKSLGMPDVKPSIPNPATTGVPRSGTPLRRLGMGRPGLYGDKKPKF
ncbi:ATP-dependent DNA helicase srs2 [Naganishia albida]|nr:ATP-dependent DNA helicase srs2 [Naganishia albida]